MTKSTSQSERLKRLSPEQRTLLLKLLQAEGADQGDDRQSIPRRAASTPPLSFAQQRLWFLDQLAPGGTAYNVPIAVRLSGALELAALRRALDQLIRRHEALRTTFRVVGSEPAQIIAPALRLPLPTLDLRAIAGQEREAVARRLIGREIERPFDLARGPLLRITLLRLRDAEHILIIIAHHIISDGWSQAIFVREVSALYQTFASRKPAPLPELPIQYADFAAWQRAWLEGAGDHAPSLLQTQLDYWRSQLAGSPSLLELPADHSRPAIQTYRGAGQRLTLPDALIEQLHATGRRERATPFMTLLAVFLVLLQRYTGQTDLAIGTPIAGRTHSELEGLIGFFANTLVLRTDLAGDPSFLGLLRRVREVTLAAQAYQDLPFERLVEELQPERNLSYHPLFQVMFVFQNVPTEVIEIPGLTLRSLDVEHDTALFDLTLMLMETEHGLIGKLEYNTDLFDATTISRMIGHLGRLFAGVVAKPDRRISELPLLAAAERQQLLVEWNDTTVEVSRRGEAGLAPTWLLPPDSWCVHELFEAQAEKTPDAIALVFEQQHLTYRALNQSANRLARVLRRRGVAAEQVVGLRLQRSLELPLALLAVLKASAAYLPLDPDYPSERISFMLHDSRARVLVTNDQRPTTNDVTRGQESGVRGRDNDTPAPDPQSPIPDPWTTVELQAEWPAIAAQPGTNLAGAASATLAYVLYTSGSTGTPKAVAMPHHALLNLLDWQRRAHPGAARTLQFAAFSFDASFQELFATWSCGGTLVLAPQAVRRDVAALARLLNAEQLARVFLPVVMLQHLAQALAAAPHLPLALREVITAGEALLITPPLSSLFARLPLARLHNHYGPTETHVVSAFGLPPSVTGWPPSPPIGRPITNSQAYLLDRNLQPVPLGALGELYLGGATLARGYLNRPDLTAERFVPIPFGEVSGIGYRVLGAEPSDTRYPTPDTRLYKTGDLARYLPDGTLVFVGRMDGQVKLRGYRIELGEIEAALRAHPAVALAAVLARSDPSQPSAAPVLIAYIVPASDEGRMTKDQGSDSSFVHRPSSLADELRAFLKQHLPGYMLPAQYVLRETLPLSRSGKLDRRALAAEQPPVLPRSFVAPRTELEARVAAVWAEVLGRDAISVEEDFFALGGHSLLATQVLARLRESERVELAVRDLFREPTVAGLAAGIAALQWAAQARPSSTGPDDEREEIEL